jgi:hypothetical protein
VEDGILALLEDVAQPSRVVAAAISPNALRRKDSARRVASENYSDVRPLARSEPAMTEDTARMQRNGTMGALWGVSPQIQTVRE